MLNPLYKKQFSKDTKLAIKRGKRMDKLKTVMSALIADKSLAQRYRDHQLIGNYNDCRECHIEPDWATGIHGNR